MNTDWLKEIREKHGYSQAEVASRLNMSQSQYSRHEANPKTLPYGDLETLSILLGFDIRNIEQEQHIYPTIDSRDPYRKQEEQVRALKRLILSDAEARSISDRTKSMGVEIPNIDNFLELIKRYEHKPNIVLAGRYDTGKSYLANQLLGEEFLPSSYQPTTKLVSIVRHVSERPEWQKEEVYFLQKDFWRNGDEYQFSLSNLNDKSRYQYCKGESTLTSLREHGVFFHGRRRQERMLKQLDVHTAVIYINSPLLLACNIIDTPGFSDSNIEGLDKERFQPITDLMDILVYTSSVNGFMDARDQAYLKYLLSHSSKGFENFSQHPSLGNVFIVCTLASPELINEAELENVLESGADRLSAQIQESILRELESRTGRTYSIPDPDLDERFYSFWAQSEDRCERLLKSLSNYLGRILPDTYMYNFENDVNEFKLRATEGISRAIGYYQKVRDDVEGARIKYQTIKDYESQRKKEVNREVIQLTTLIRTLKLSDRESFSLEAQRLLQVDTLKDIINDKYKDQKEAKDNAPLLIFSKLEAMAKEAVNEDYDKTFVPALKEFVKTYSSFTFEPSASKPGAIEIPFNFRRLFIDSFVGGMAIAVGAAFGPIGLGVGAAVAAVAWVINRQSWQERLSKQIAEKFEEKQLILDLEKGIEDFWNNVESSFHSLFKQAEFDWLKSIAELESMIDINSMVTAEQNIQDLEDLNRFFAQLQWETKS